MPNPTRPLLARLTVRKTVHFVSTLEVYEGSETTPSQSVVTTTGVEVDELPPSVSGLRKATYVAPLDLAANK